MEDAFIGTVMVGSLLTHFVLHEAAHAWVADVLGAQAPRSEGRVSLRPWRHLSVVGSLLVPLVGLVVTHGAFAIAWAKPVSIDVSSFKSWRVGIGLASAAGPAANAVAAVVAALLMRAPGVPELVRIVLFLFGFVGLFQAAFNAMPIPPLDGSRVVAALLPEGLNVWYIGYELYVGAAVACAAVTATICGIDVIGGLFGRPLSELMFGMCGGL